MMAATRLHNLSRVVPGHGGRNLHILRTIFSAESSKSGFRSESSRLGMIGAGVMGAAAFGAISFVDCSDDCIPAPEYPWNHHGAMSAYDSGALRRGHQVYAQVCATCHSMDRIAFRNLIGVSHTEDEVKAICEELDVMDGPNDEGEMFERPGKPSDYFPRPYANEEAARFSNNGAYPPDLSLICKARFGGPSYVFALLTGYRDPPAGVPPREGQSYNPYFPGGWIGMAKQLEDGLVEYEDGTPGTASQMAHDVSMFLAWASEPEHDQRKQMGVKWCTMLFFATGLCLYYKKLKWNVIKNRRLVFTS